MEHLESQSFSLLRGEETKIVVIKHAYLSYPYVYVWGVAICGNRSEKRESGLERVMECRREGGKNRKRAFMMHYVCVKWGNGGEKRESVC